MKLRTALLAIGGISGGLALYNRRLERGGGQLPNWLCGEVRYYRWRGRDLAYSVAGEGEPLLLVHGVYAGASSFEFRKNFEELSKSFRVYALNLLGCGLSERPSRRYEPEDVALQIEDFVREEIGGPVHLVASSLTAALVMPAVVRSGQRSRWRSSAPRCGVAAWGPRPSGSRSPMHSAHSGCTASSCRCSRTTSAPFARTKSAASYGGRGP